MNDGDQGIKYFTITLYSYVVIRIKMKIHMFIHDKMPTEINFFNKYGSESKIIGSYTRVFGSTVVMIYVDISLSY